MAEKLYFPSGDGLRLCALAQEAEGPVRGTVVLAHGITVDKEESGGSTGIGAFVELASALIAAGYNVLRFDYRGHGESGGRQEEMTIAGELLDLAAAMTQAQTRWGSPPALVGASFGAVTSALYAADHNDLPCLVLWNPVLDLVKTFLVPLCPRPRRIFNPGDRAFLDAHEYILLDSFRIGRKLIEEMKTVAPYARMAAIGCPVLTLHGELDFYVPLDVAREFALCRYAYERSSSAVPFTKDRAAWLEHHLYVCPHGLPELARHLLFRDQLRNSGALRQEYRELKEEALRRAGGRRQVYVDEKARLGQEFFRGVLGEA